MSDFVRFKELLSQRADSGNGIPQFVLKDNSDIGQVFSRMVSSEAPKEGETSGQVTGRYIDEICDSLNKDENKEARDRFEDAVSLFTTKVKNAWDAVTAIKETGNELAAEMSKIAATQLASNDFVSQHLNYENLVSSFPIFAWDGTKTMGSINEVIKHVNALMTNEGEPSDQVNQSLFNIIVSDMTKYGQVEDVTITEDARKAAIDALLEVCQNTPAGTIEQAIDAVTGINKINEVSNALSNLNNLSYAQTHLFDNVKTFDEAISTLFPVYDLIISEQVTPFPAAKEQVISNAKKLVTVLEIAAYHEHIQRTTVFSQAVLLPGGLVNSDIEEEFKKAGGTTKMLGEYVRFMYNDNLSAIPVMGIKVGDIVSGAATVSEKVAKDIANVSSRIKLAKNMANTSAYRMVMRDYISKYLKRTEEGTDMGKIAAKVEDNMKGKILPIVENIRQYNVNFVDAAMNGIVAVQYPGSFTEHLFHELGAAYISATEQNSTITAEDLHQVDISVISRLICTFLTDNLVEYIPENA